MIRKSMPAWAGAAAAFLTSAVAHAEFGFNLQPPQTSVAREVYDLHMIVLWICVAIFAGVFGMMLYSIVKHRKSAGHQAAHFHENTTVEVAWTVIPLVILIVMAIPASKALLAMRDTSAPDMTIKVTGYQWRWGYEYLLGEGEGIRFISSLSTPREQIEGTAPKGPNYLLEVDNPLVVPVGKKVRVLITSQDVIHSWWIPAFGVKQDANPGFIRDAWFRPEKEGTYRGQCVELCGKEHAFMPIVVEVVSQQKYAQWAAGQKQKMAAAATQGSGPVDGKAVYDKVCQVCHASGVAGAPKLGDKAAWGPRMKQGEDTLMQHAVKGIRGMPPKGGSPDLSEAQIKAAIDYMMAPVK
jgi:cytochrome c oxidase subunit 2